MDSVTLRTLIATAIIFFGFCLFAFYLPNIMLFVGQISPIFGGVIVALFILGPFILIGIKGHFDRKKNNDNESK